jgi:predicted NBD/HSP70 family sugar kinase
VRRRAAAASAACVEAYVGGAHEAAHITRTLAAPRAPRSLALALAGGDPAAVTPSHVDQAAQDGDAWALEYWGTLAPLLAIALGNAVAMLNPRPPRARRAACCRARRCCASRR